MSNKIWVVAAVVVAAVLTVSATAVATSNNQFEPDQRLSKGWFGVLTYKFIRDEVPGGKAALEQCDLTPRFSDLADESKFKRDALHCLASLGYFDDVPLSDGGLPGWRNVYADGTAPPTTTTAPPTTTCLDAICLVNHYWFGSGYNDSTDNYAVKFRVNRQCATLYVEVQLLDSNDRRTGDWGNELLRSPAVGREFTVEVNFINNWDSFARFEWEYNCR